MKAIITISQEGQVVDINLTTFDNQKKETMLGCESHVLGLIILDHINKGTFHSELSLQMKNLNGEL